MLKSRKTLQFKTKIKRKITIQRQKNGNNYATTNNVHKTSRVKLDSEHHEPHQIPRVQGKCK